MKYLSCLLLSVLLLASTGVSAVTDEEVQKMEQAMPEKAVVQPEKPRTLLVFDLSKGFQHTCIPYWAKALDVMSQKTGAFKVEHSTDMSVFNAEALKGYDAICFNNTTKLTPDAAQQKAIMDFIQSGKGIIGIHAATDNFDDWPEGAMMMGGIFKGHPWTANGTWAIKLDEPEHPLLKSFGGKGFQVNDEIYRTLPPQYSRTNQRVLMSLDMSDSATKNARGVTPEDMDTGISWIKRVGEGRLFYCSLGHNHHLTWTKPVLEHYLAGIQYALGDLKVDDAPLGAKPAVDTEKVSSLTAEINSYDWAKSRAPLSAMEQLVREHSGKPEALSEIEKIFLGALKAESTLPAKDFYCRMLSTIGSKNSVETLSAMLKDEKTFDMALYALDGISGPEAETAMLAALENAKEARNKAALITSLGVRSSQASISKIAGFLKDENAVIAESAIEALTGIGGSQAVSSLKAAYPGKHGLGLRIQDALLRCAANLNQAEKQSLYNELFTGGETALIKASALAGLAETSDPKVAAYCLEALQSDDASLVGAGGEVLAKSEDKSLLEKAAALTSKVSLTSQVGLITALSKNKLRVGGKAAEELAGSPNKEVRIAAYHALASLGEAKTALLLGRAAASAQERDEREAAQESLYRLPDADQTIVSAISNETLDEAVRLEMIDAASERSNQDAVKVLLQTAESSNAKIAERSTRALQRLAGPGDVESLTLLVIKKPGPNNENALDAAAMKIKDVDKRAEALLKAYGTVQEPESKAALLRVMGQLGDPHSVSLLNKEYKSDNPVISEAAFRAMTDWPGTEFTAAMKEIAQNSTDTRNKVLAFRAYVRMLGTDSAGLIEAYNMVDRPEEKTVVISALANSEGEQVLTFLEKISEDEQYKAAAQMSLLSVSEKMGRSNAAVAAALLKLRDNSANETIRRRASTLISGRGR